MLYGQAAVTESGIPPTHANVFSQVAQNQNSIIISRSVGKYATQLILENYATKGFHIKTKSCNWGPMAGFVLADPRFSKNGVAADKVRSQLKSVNSALHEGATLKGLFITEARRRALPALFAGDGSTTYVEHHVSDNERRISTSKGGLILEFILKRQLPHRVTGGGTTRLWAVCYRHRHQLPEKKLLGPQITTSFGQLYQVMGLTDPRGDKATKATYRAVMTGDYDLWGCFPLKSLYNPNGDDRRRVRDSNNQLFNFDTFTAQESRHTGNMTRRLHAVRNRLNTGFRNTGYQGGNIVHHSDEAGRPMVDNLEVESIAFFPSGERMFFTTISDYKDFIEMARSMGYQTILNAWWHLYKEADTERMNNILASRNAHIGILNSIKARGIQY
ncbi:anthrax toxin-like adenylyl cyclase domain-containing protein [Motilimonas sp. 1_MG-2023]|uniref:anthrax toxin-like adenylyl cyclase domain-containing protein n=1 Tax=Motilimonas sp. 1_MG-2023 TaxID=3062672 RepID=UPI0026E1EEAF|nr:anthrax toxin-like adenylyl cyclase domain-containing protein [Motilimonas sp. 1_MG-2023]MDO6526103.1 anthrax toxin-like adenylyl cyclase domain-containing protein [Motilimonas sp. 1_MG-2023]